MVQTFYAVSGGSWSRRPAGIDTLWRLQNVQVTLGPWSLNELEFYDPWCFFPKMFFESRLVGGFCLRFGKINSWEVWVALGGWPWWGLLGVNLFFFFWMTWFAKNSASQVSNVGILKHWNLNFY